MSGSKTRDIEYTHDGDRMLGLLSLPTTTPDGGNVSAMLPGIVLVHDAFGLSADMALLAEGYASLGFAVFAADVWGERMTPQDDSEIGPLIGSMVSDRASWIGRVAAAHEVIAAQPEVDADALVTVGYCFGGSSALEHLRTGGTTRGVVSVHGGLDLIAPGWQKAQSESRVLLCTGADDPMATAAMREDLQSSLSGAGIDWELDLYSDTKHAFTNPKSDLSPMTDAVAYNPRSAARAWASTVRFLRELFPETALSVGRAGFPLIDQRD